MPKTPLNAGFFSGLLQGINPENLTVTDIHLI